MDSRQLTVRAKFLTAPKSPGVPGILMLNESKFCWKSNDPKGAQDLDVSFHSIKGHRANKETPTFQKALLNMFKDGEMKEGYLFEFANFKDRDECRNFVVDFFLMILSSVHPAFRGDFQLFFMKLEIQPIRCNLVGTHFSCKTCTADCYVTRY
ncbi:hypothetical protein KP509_22G065200 [Ceratopteris richardii]|uniref:TFIIH p62 subunit N-terminal domain-containing protein n=1 Tax=Ceratopteris richardii TaxID=49495 RepID=A0A8T2S996_CERRI|nr:hypothetical protein KP509_22G065200 [Ceratopteris richardii]